MIGNIVRSANISGDGWTLDLHVTARDERAYEAAKTCLAVLVDESDPASMGYRASESQKGRGDSAEGAS